MYEAVNLAIPGVEASLMMIGPYRIRKAKFQADIQINKI